MDSSLPSKLARQAREWLSEAQADFQHSKLYVVVALICGLALALAFLAVAGFTAENMLAALLLVLAGAAFGPAAILIMLAPYWAIPTGCRMKCTLALIVVQMAIGLALFLFFTVADGFRPLYLLCIPLAIPVIGVLLPTTGMLCTVLYFACAGISKLLRWAKDQIDIHMERAEKSENVSWRIAWVYAVAVTLVPLILFVGLAIALAAVTGG